MTIKRIIVPVLALGAALGEGNLRGAQGQTTPCAPIDSRPAEAPNFQPAFPNQTRACAVRSTGAYDVTVVATGLERPWAVEPLPGGGFLVTEKAGRLRHVSAAGVVGPAITGVPPVDARGQGGLLDVELSPTFARDRTVFWSFSEPREGGNGTSVARGVLSADGTRVDQVRVILQTRPTYNNGLHFGSRLAFGPDSMLYVTTGERSDTVTRPQAQHLNSHLGKTLRIRPDGTPAPGNPFAGQAGALSEIWSYGHRNVQGSTFDDQGRFWTIEHGPRGGDEVNLVERGRNYGWPLVGYGVEYSGRPIRDQVSQRAGFEQPVYYWSPVIAPGGAQFYTGSAFPAWRGNLFIGGMVSKSLVRLVMQGSRVVGEEHLLTDRNERIRDVRQGPDGALYVVTDNPQGQLWRISPRAGDAAAAPAAGQQQPFSVGQPLGVTAAGVFAPISSNVKVFGGIVNAESCVYDRQRNLIVVINRGVNQNQVPNDAFVSLLNHDGSVHTPAWIGANRNGLVLNHPLGSEIWNGKLYVADRDGGTAANDPSISVVRWFDMTTGAPAGQVRVEDSAGFNDLAIAADGTIYATQTGSADDPTSWRIYRVEQGGRSEVLLRGAPLNRPNGIHCQDNDGNLVVVNMGNTNVQTFSTRGQLLKTEQAAQAGNDGLVIMPDGTKYVSSVLQGGVSRIRPGQAADLIASNIPSAASMCYDAGANQLVIPLNPNNAVAVVPLR